MDERFRELERAAASGDVAARVRLLRARAQAGVLNEDDPSIGRELGGCWLEKLLAEGNGFRDYLALHPDAGECCLKVFQPRPGLEVFETDAQGRTAAVRAPESAQASAFRCAARVWSSFDHPNLVTVHEVGEDAGHTFVRMELVRGDTLWNLRQRAGRLELRTALASARDVAQGLAALHERGRIHEDLSPHDLVLTPEGRTKITSLGRIGGLRPVVTGRPVYISPEQVNGLPAGPHTDVFALGVILYELLSGKRPFDAAVVVQLLRRVVSEDAAPLRTHDPSLPEALERVVARCLLKQPQDRPSAAGLAEDLDRLQSP